MITIVVDEVFSQFFIYLFVYSLKISILTILNSPEHQMVRLRKTSLLKEVNKIIEGQNNMYSNCFCSGHVKF